MYIIFILIYQFTANTFTEFIPNYHKNNNTIQISENNNVIEKQLYDEKAKNKRLEEEIQNLKNKYNQRTNEINKLKKIIQTLTNENINLKNEINNLKLNQFNQININDINKLKEIIIKKDIEINELKLKLPKENLSMNDIIVINFLSTDQTIRCGIPCLADDIFAEVEEKLYQKFNEFRNTNNIFLFKGNIILRFKKIKENNIHDGDTIQLVTQE